MEIKRGRLIVIDGPDGSGKQTQANFFLKRLLQVGYPAQMLDFPQYGKNIFAETVNAYLKGDFGDATKINPYLASLPYAGDRWKVAPVIREGLKNGVIFVSNRYKSSNDAHQGAKIVDPKDRRNFREWLNQVEFGEDGFNIPKPDLSVLLYVDPKISRDLVTARSFARGREKDGHERNLEYQIKVAESFREVAESDPTWRIVDCMDKSGKRILKADAIARKVWQTVIQYLPPLEDVVRLRPNP